MPRNHVSSTVAGSAGFVNLVVAALAIFIIGAGYFSAVSQFAGIA